MIVELHNKLGRPERIEATRIVIRGDNDEPICIAIQPGPDQYFVVHRGDGDEEMNRALRALGFHETVISDFKDLPKPPGTLWTPGS